MTDEQMTSPARTAAEQRFRERMEREEQRRDLSRRRTGAIVIVVLAFVTSFLGAWLARSKTPKAEAGTRLVRITPRPVTPEATVPVIPAQPTATAEAEQPVREAAPKPSPKPAPKPRPKREIASASAPETQRVRIAIGDQGYEPSVVRVKANAKVRITVGKGEGCAAGFLIPDLGISKNNSAGAVTFTVGPLKPGTYRFSCGMQMVTGTLVAD